ncbi:MAG: tetratricopeptide repeat protein [Burkholderiaceae bacterium]|nr:MAG: tetratricopeptide repeat protein [Burkholderiaceae bacterium]
MFKTIFASLLLGITLNALAAGTEFSAPEPTAQSYYDDAKASLANNKWKPALANLKKAVELDPNNADIHNLLGYSYRKAGDLPKAFEEYAIALKLNPKHTGALEYRGEAYLMANDLESAENALKTLEGLCGTSCEEYKDLSQAIAQYKAKQ